MIIIIQVQTYFGGRRGGGCWSFSQGEGPVAGGARILASVWPVTKCAFSPLGRNG